MTEAVYVATELNGRTVEVGRAYFTRRNNVLTTSFRYDEEYLARPGSYTLDPSMPLLEGNHTISGLPGAFADCSPDRWGKNLIAKMVRIKALRDSRTVPLVSDLDYLLGVSDLTRQGALRFRVGARWRLLGS